MDGEKNNIFKKKDLNLTKFSRVFKRHPVVPLFGDMQITLEAFIKRSPHFDEKVWGQGAEDVRVIQQEYPLSIYLSRSHTYMILPRPTHMRISLPTRINITHPTLHDIFGYSSVDMSC